MAIGRPIPVNRMAKDDPRFDAEVDRVHRLFVTGMVDVYEKCKGKFGWATVPLCVE